MRLTLNDDEVTKLLTLLQQLDFNLYNTINNQVKTDRSKDKSKKVQSIKEATKARERVAKAKILNAINVLRLEDRALTTYSIAKESGCSYNTVKKYQEVGKW